MLEKSKSKCGSTTKKHDHSTERALHPGYEKVQFQRAAFDPTRWSQRGPQKSRWRKLDRWLLRQVEH